MPNKKDPPATSADANPPNPPTGGGEAGAVADGHRDSGKENKKEVSKSSESNPDTQDNKSEDKKDQPVKPEHEKYKGKIGDIDIKKARKIVLDTILSDDEQEEKPKDSKKLKKQIVESSTPLFLKQEKVNRDEIDEEKIAKKVEGMEEVKEITKEEPQTLDGPTPLFLKEEKMDKDDASRKEIIKKSEAIKEIKEISTEKEIKEDEKSPTPLFLKEKEISEGKAHAKDVKKGIIVAKEIEEIKDDKENKQEEKISDKHPRIKQESVYLPIKKEEKAVKEKKETRIFNYIKNRIQIIKEKVKSAKKSKLKLKLKQKSQTTKKLKKVKEKKDIILKTQEDARRHKDLLKKKIAARKIARAAKRREFMFSLGLIKIFVNNVLYLLTVSALLFIIIYSLFIILVTQFDIDNKMTRKASEYLPIPAIITDNGVIEYYDFKDALDKDIRSLIKDSDGGILKVWKLVD